MCLTKIHKRKPPASGVGWKLFQLNPRTGMVHDWFRLRAREPGVWYQAKGPTLIGYKYDVGMYPVGFHIFLTKPELPTGSRDEIALRVRWRRGETAGLDTTVHRKRIRTVVAKEMKILKEANPLIRRKWRMWK